MPKWDGWPTSLPSLWTAIEAAPVMELFRRVAHEHGTGVIVVTHDHRALDVLDTTCEMEDGAIQQGKSQLSLVQ